MNNNERKTLYDKIIWILTVALISSMYIWTTSTFGAYILMGITAVIFLIYAIAHSMYLSLEIGAFHVAIAAFGLYCIISALWAWDSGEAISKGVTIFEILICMSVLYLYYQEQTDLWCLANAIKWAGFIVTVYAIYVYGIDTIREIISDSSRLDNEFANINSIGMLSAITVCITLYELLFRQKNLLSAILCIPCIVLIAATGSRKALVMLVMGIFFCLIFRYSGKNIISTIFRVAVIIVICFFLFRFLLSLDIFSGVMERMEGLTSLITGTGEVDSSAMKRGIFVQLGLKQFLKTPIFGIGIGSSGVFLQQSYGWKSYLHNNFVELLCCGGIIGFCIYYYMYVYAGIKLLQTRLQDPMSKLCIILLVINLVMDYGAVSYYSKQTYIYFMLFFLQVRKTQEFRTVETGEDCNDGTKVEELHESL